MHCRSRAPGSEMVRSELYFGLALAEGGTVTAGQWDEFLAREVTPRFPAGLTVLDARGQWQDGNGNVVREPSKVLVIFHAAGAGEGGKLEEIRAAYRKRFGAESVLRATSRAWVDFR